MKNLVIKSSIALSDSQKERLEKGLSSSSSDNYNFVYQIEPIVGGIVIVDGDNIIDASFNKELITIQKTADSLVNKLHNEVENFAEFNKYVLPKFIRDTIQDISKKAYDVNACGRVCSSADGVIKISGLQTCQYGELLLVGNSAFAIAMNLEVNTVGAIVLGGYSSVEYGDIVYSTGKIVEVPVGDALLGRVVNPLGEPIDDTSILHTDKTRKIENDAPMIIDRDKVNSPLSTGILAIDAMVPIGKGQRELIIGDRQTGKTTIAIDTILNQKGKNVICVYVAIGQRASSVNKIIRLLKANDSLKYTVLVVSTADDTAPLQYIAPYSGCAIAEEFMYQGKDVLIVYDDLSKHAVAYRSISLLLKRPAGREAYPGDVFYIHSRLLERAAKLSNALGGGSMTALPIIETQAGDISQYIPTNVISITDGQIYLEKELFNAGIRPAVNVGLSVSRVGGSAQIPIIRKLSAKLRLDLAHYRELAVFTQFGSDLDTTTKNILLSGEKTTEAIKQKENQPMDFAREFLYLYAILSNKLNDIPNRRISEFLDGYYNFVISSMPAEIKNIIETAQLTDSVNAMLQDCTTQYKEYFLS